MAAPIAVNFVWDRWESLSPTPWRDAPVDIVIDRPGYAEAAEALGVGQGAERPHPSVVMQRLFSVVAGCFDFPYPSDGDGPFQGFHAGLEAVGVVHTPVRTRDEGLWTEG